MRAARLAAASVVVVAVALLAGCSVAEPEPIGSEPASRSVPSPSASASPTSSPASRAGAPTPSPTRPSAAPSSAAPAPAPVRVEVDNLLADVGRLADGIGPREATSDNFAEAADLVERRLAGLGYRVRRTAVPVPAGDSWGTPVEAGTSANVIAEPAGFDPREPHVVVGAHLDTVAVSPGAEDNASGVAVMLELARLASREPPELPVQFIAFGAEEPRGDGDRLHHFGSQQLVADLSRAEREAITAMVSLDRVGVRDGFVPVCRGGPDGSGLRGAVREAADRVGVSTEACDNRSSDHWSYEKASVPAVRIGSVPYAGYHSRGDVPSVVDRRQLDRVSRLMWAWLSNPR